MDIVLLAASLGLILVGAELFTNGIEWFGHKLNLAEGAVGSVLAAVATAMPETLIPVIAIVGPLVVGGHAGDSAEVGVGAILGAPFMLSTLAMFVTGLGVLVISRGGRRSTQLTVNVRVLGRDVLVFVGAYAVAVGTAFLPPSVHGLKWPLAAGLLVAYGFYVRAHFRDEPGESDPADLNRLHLTRLAGRAATPAAVVEPGQPASVLVPRLRIIIAQVLLALTAIVVGAQVFVGAVEDLSRVIGLDPRILALVLAPIATELPEKLNSLLWVRVGKDTLAMGNITGAMVFQSCIPTLLGIAFTEWAFTEQSALSFASAGAAFLATILIFGTMFRAGRLSAWTLLAGGPIYLLYVVAAVTLPVPIASVH
ncbi:MAG TPA: sodium:calcium antiporter [Candidatus Limnocylindria bacterium]|nr:sodium:calcium antiporter [Candidatus Limnocylindria bacterium]